jgi:hypothetical protein
MCPACFATAAVCAAWIATGIAGATSTAAMAAVALGYIHPKSAASSESKSKENSHVHSPHSI